MVQRTMFIWWGILNGFLSSYGIFGSALTQISTSKLAVYLAFYGLTFYLHGYKILASVALPRQFMQISSQV